MKDEKKAIKEYSDKAKRITNKKTKKQLNSIAKDEKKHLKILNRIYKDYKCEKRSLW